MVATELIYELNPVLILGGQNQQIEFMYQPIDNASRSRIEIEIQTNVLSAVGEWEVNAIDWLEVSGE